MTMVAGKGKIRLYPSTALVPMPGLQGREARNSSTLDPLLIMESRLGHYGEPCGHIWIGE